MQLNEKERKAQHKNWCAAHSSWRVRVFGTHSSWRVAMTMRDSGRLIVAAAVILETARGVVRYAQFLQVFNDHKRQIVR